MVAVDGLAPLDHFNAMLPRTWGVRTEDCVSKTHSYIYCTIGYVSQYSSSETVAVVVLLLISVP